MPIDIVDALEVVDVEHEQGDRVVGPAGVRECLTKTLVEGAVVEEAGEGIGLRLVLEAGADLRVVERKRRGIAESLCQLEIVVVE